MQARDIILMPSVTEKNNMLRGDEVKNCYVFRVAINATKNQIKAAVKELWNVKVEKVNTVRVLGKYKRQGANMGKRADWKKAFVKLASGESIDIFES